MVLSFLGAFWRTFIYRRWSKDPDCPRDFVIRLYYIYIYILDWRWIDSKIHQNTLEMPSYILSCAIKWYKVNTPGPGLKVNHAQLFCCNSMLASASEVKRRIFDISPQVVTFVRCRHEHPYAGRLVGNLAQKSHPYWFDWIYGLRTTWGPKYSQTRYLYQSTWLTT